VREQLNAAARSLPTPVRSGEDGGTIEAFHGWLDHNELELALDELEMLGNANEVPDDFWSRLATAAQLMELEAHEARCRSHIQGGART